MKSFKSLTTTDQFYYEPTSVLDPNLTSSPASAVTATTTTPPNLHPLPHHHHLLPAPPPTDDWDPVAWLLSERDDADLLRPPLIPQSFDPNTQFFNPLDDLLVSNSSPSFDRNHLDLLLQAATYIECGDFASAQGILARLNYYLQSPSGNPIQRAAFHFKEALLSLLPHNPSVSEPPLSAAQIVRRIGAHKAFSDLSLIPQFASFTANQTLLEAFDAAGAAASVHVIDFDLGLGGQWSSFFQELAARSRTTRRPSPAIRLTAVVPDESGGPEAALAAENLRDFARGLGLRLAVDLVLAASLSSLRLATGEPVAVVLSPAIFRSLGGAPESSAALLRFVRRASPRAVVFVDADGGGGGGNSLRQSIADGVDYYAAVMESVEAAAAATGAGDEPVRRVERGVARPRVFGSVCSWWTLSNSKPWAELLSDSGFASMAFSEFAESQAEWLVQRAPSEGYHVARRDGSLVLTWRGRQLAATSAWRC
ncbi:scarecrow-like protein 15 [Typha angustifolia]|uniref:scarecrow-like protein 15 n=1 Tax=Typha angustifolia TaxID=59011 RepID=UPI003C2D91FF